MYTPQRLFGEVGLSTDVLGHEPFLERARLQREQEHDGSARLALGAYVVARLVDRLVVVIAPKIIGRGISAIGELNINRLRDAITFSEFKTRRLGPDMVFDGRIDWNVESE